VENRDDLGNRWAGQPQALQKQLLGALGRWSSTLKFLLPVISEHDWASDRLKPPFLENQFPKAAPPTPKPKTHVTDGLCVCNLCTFSLYQSAVKNMLEQFKNVNTMTQQPSVVSSKLKLEEFKRFIRQLELSSPSIMYSPQKFKLNRII